MFFHILIFHGERTVQWHKVQYHKQEGYESFEELLEKTTKEAQVHMALLCGGWLTLMTAAHPHLLTLNN